MEAVTLNAYAKINLSLEVLGRREDGYHDICSLMQGVGLHDVIKITKCPGNGTKYTIPHCTIAGVVVYLCTDAKTIPADMTNLAFKGAGAVLEAAGSIPFRELVIEIDKKLPVAAGIAGGSGNAAASMLGVNALLGDPFSLRELMELGARVGADVPFSLMMNAKMNEAALTLRGLEEASVSAWISGIGDIVAPAEPVHRYVILANPGVQVSTKDAYEAINRIHCGMTRTAEGKLFVNDLEAFTLGSCAEARGLKELIERELCADEVLMSGSGPTIVAYYKDKNTAEADDQRLRALAGDGSLRTWLTETGAE